MLDKDFEKFVDSLKRQCQGRAVVIGAYRFILEDVKTGEKIVKYYKNIIPTVGFQLITNNLTDPTPDNDILISHIALGDGTTAPAIGDTTLENELYRNAVASRANSGAIAYATGYFNQTECSGTYKEAGIFCDGSLTPDDGILLSRVAIDVVKSLTQKLTVDWTLTFANA